MIVSSLATGHSHCRPSILSRRSDEDMASTLAHFGEPSGCIRQLRCYSSVWASVFYTSYFPLVSTNTEGNIETGNGPNPKSTLYFSRSSAD